MIEIWQICHAPVTPTCPPYLIIMSMIIIAYKVIPRAHVEASKDSTTRLHPCQESVCGLPLTSNYRHQYPRSHVLNRENHIATSSIKRCIYGHACFRKIPDQLNVEAGQIEYARDAPLQSRIQLHLCSVKHRKRSSVPTPNHHLCRSMSPYTKAISFIQCQNF